MTGQQMTVRHLRQVKRWPWWRIARFLDLTPAQAKRLGGELHDLSD